MGLSAFLDYAKGDTPDSGTAASPDQDEFDYTVDYHFKEGRFDRLLAFGSADRFLTRMARKEKTLMNSESYSTMIFLCFDDLNRCRNVRLEGDFIGDDAPF